MVLYLFCSNGDPGVKNVLAVGGFGLKNKTDLKIFFSGTVGSGA